LVSFYVAGPEQTSNDSDARQHPPLLLLHSINASASAHEVKPLFEALKTHRRVYAIDLPGYGHSERSERTYDQDLMVSAVQAVASEMLSDCRTATIDALAVSLSCEFLAKAALQTPARYRSLALISPTGFARRAPRQGPPEANCGKPGVYRFLTLPLIGKGLFRLLTSRASIRFFLRKTWGSDQIDEEMYQTSCRLARLPEAHRAPFHFLSGYLFSADILTAFKALTQPVWLAHGSRGDFADFSRIDAISDKPAWQTSVFETGALPYFELPGRFIQTFEQFLADVGRK